MMWTCQEKLSSSISSSLPMRRLEEIFTHSKLMSFDWHKYGKHFYQSLSDMVPLHSKKILYDKHFHIDLLDIPDSFNIWESQSFPLISWFLWNIWPVDRWRWVNCWTRRLSKVRKRPLEISKSLCIQFISFFRDRLKLNAIVNTVIWRSSHKITINFFALSLKAC